MTDWQSKIKKRDELAEIVKQAREKGLKVGFTSGVFDLLHAGHVDFLQTARRRCDLLIVGLNSDQSVKKYKGPSRPLVEEGYRQIALAGIESVDYVFLFDERRNQINLETLQPDFYFKAGDYSPAQLTSADVIKAHGGQVEILPLNYSISTTQIVERAGASLGLAQSAIESLPASHSQSDGPGGIDGQPTSGPTDQKDCPTPSSSRSWKSMESGSTVHLDIKPAKCRPALFVDRDGTINTEIEYLHQPERFSLLPGAGEGLKKFQAMGYWIVVITTQAGIGLGYFTHEDFYRVNRSMFKALKPFDVMVDRIYYCPHSLRDHCRCRKPGTLLLEQAALDLNIDLAHSVMIGDKTSDILAGQRLNLKTILVRSGHAGQDHEYDVQPDFSADSLSQAADMILAAERNI